MGLRRSFEALVDRIEDARLEDRVGYRLVICPRVPFPGLNGVWAEDDAGPDVVHEVEAAIAEVEVLGGPCWIEVRAGRTPATEQLVRRLGFTHEEAVPGMVLRPDELVEGRDRDLMCRRVQDAAGLSVAASVGAAGFEVPRELIEALYTPRVAAVPGLSIYVAYAHGHPVSTAMAWAGDGAVGIYNVATPPEHRGRGYGRAVTAKAVADGFATGADLAWLQASQLGQPVYRAMGFRQVETYLVLGRPSTG
jgi:ribosomal protein S18 acetylase RimI-like enzyme